MKDGRIWRYEPVSSTTQLLEPEIIGTPAAVNAIGTGPDAIYAGAFLGSGTVARINHQTQEITQLRGTAQASSIAAHQNNLIIGEYPSVVIYVGTTDSWNWGTNPKELFRLSRGEPLLPRSTYCPHIRRERGCCRHRPGYSYLGGALVTFDLDGNFTMHRNVVPKQTVVALAYQRGLIYGATSVYGGLDSDPTEPEAKLFIWDVNSAQLIWTGTAVSNAKIIPSLAFDSSARLWGLTSTGTLFKFDTARRLICRTHETGLTAINNSWGTPTPSTTGPLIARSTETPAINCFGSILEHSRPKSSLPTLAYQPSPKAATFTLLTERTSIDTNRGSMATCGKGSDPVS